MAALALFVFGFVSEVALHTQGDFTATSSAAYLPFSIIAGAVLIAIGSALSILLRRFMTPGKVAKSTFLFSWPVVFIGLFFSALV